MNVQNNTGILTLPEIIIIQRTQDRIFEFDNKEEENDILKHLEDQEGRNSVVVDLRLGPEVFLSSEGKVRELSEHGQDAFVTIEPGAFAQLLIHEKLKIPLDILGLISMKFSYKVKGLINVSGFHVDPGYQGRIVFSVYNAGPTKIILQRKENVFMIIFTKIGKKVDRPVQSKFQDKYHIQAVHFKDLVGPSITPGSLNERIKDLEPLKNQVEKLESTVKSLNLLKKIFIAAIGLLGTAVAEVITHFLEHIFNLAKGS